MVQLGDLWAIRTLRPAGIALRCAAIARRREVGSGSAAIPRDRRRAPRRTSAPGEKGLKADALGYVSNVVIAVASTAPAYSLAATLGFIVAVGGVGVHAPAILIVSFVPMLFISLGYHYLNLADPDAARRSPG